MLQKVWDLAEKFLFLLEQGRTVKLSFLEPCIQGMALVAVSVPSRGIWVIPELMPTLHREPC